MLSLRTRSQPSLSTPHAVLRKRRLCSIYELFRKIYTGLESSQAGGCARVTGWYEMRGISHVWGTWEAPLSGRRSSGSQLFNTIYYTLLAKAYVTPVMPEHVWGERSNTHTHKKTIKNNVRFWSEIKCLWVPTCVSEKMKWRQRVYHVSRKLLSHHNH